MHKEIINATIDCRIVEGITVGEGEDQRKQTMSPITFRSFA